MDFDDAKHAPVLDNIIISYTDVQIVQETKQFPESLTHTVVME